ncbi:acyl-CoA synthetase (AMP-forming)/AMP-acid ligase II [Pedobacter sp. UYP30]|uniref:hypothetical protein n=1 Tax=Pedobacter sp. UYP30 TaxID=1756400 RepID=UPI0033951505
MIAFFFFYGVAILGIFIAGIIVIFINWFQKKPIKSGIQFIIASVIMVVIGAERVRL